MGEIPDGKRRKETMQLKGSGEKLKAAEWESLRPITTAQEESGQKC